MWTTWAISFQESTLPTNMGKGKSVGQNAWGKRGSSGQVDKSVLSRRNSTSHYTYLYTIQLHRIRYI
jgi:hypothetical protein